jgi:cholesterol oxidase
MGRESKLVDLNVYFGNDFQNPLPIGHQDINRYGARQTSCTYCAECDLGCNYHAKNSLDLNYFYVAEKRYGAQLRAEHKAFKIVPLNQSGKEDPSQDGSYGFAVYLYDIQADQVYIVNSQRVILAAGTLNTNEILLRNRDEYHTLSRISHQLGQNFSGNGDFLSFILNSDRAADPNYGPVITQRIDFNLFDDFDAKKAFIMEDASYPALLAWYLEGQKPFWYKWSALKAFFRGVWDTFLARGNFHRSGRLLAELLKYDLSFRSSVHLCMGLDQSDGVIRLDKRRDLALDWPYQNSMPLYQAILQSMRQAKEKVNGESWFPLPTWHLNRNVSVHPLGGCRLGHGSETSVTSAESEQFGQVWSYQNLYVADGALVPTAIGANPSATIAALAEKVAEGISKIKPTAEL